MNKIVVILFISALMLMGCNQHPNDGSDLERRVEIRFSVISLSGSLLKSTGTQEERDIEKINLYGVNSYGEVIKTFADVKHGETLTVSKRVVKFYAVANPDAAIESQAPEKISDLMAMTCDYSSAPVSPFVMSDSQDFDDVINFQLVRSVAKIAVEGKGGFAVKTITVKNTPDAGFVFKQASLDVSSFGKTNYSNINGSTAYVAENSVLSPTTLTVNGTYDGNNFAIDVSFKVDGVVQSIERNKCYQVTIEPATGQDCEITVEVVNWEDVPVDPYEFDYFDN